MKVAAIQHDIVWEDPPATFARLAPLIARAADAGARLAVLTEMFSTGFSMHTERIAEPLDGPSAAFLVEQAATHGDVDRADRSPSATTDADAARRTRSCSRRPTARCTATARSTRSRYAGEHERYAPATRSLTVDVDGVRCSLFVCYDLRFADEFWQLARDDRLLRRAGQLAGGAPGALADAAPRAGRSRTRPTSWA